MIRLATATLSAIDTELNKDGGARFRGILATVLPHIADAYSTKIEDGKRSHLGVSNLGEECDRKLWYDFHWVQKVQPAPAKGEARETNSARMYRLWNRGHLEEGRMIALLLLIGCRVYQQDDKGEQFRISMLGGHHGSAIDGFIQNCPDVPNCTILGEFKTFGSKYWPELLSKGVRESNFKHYLQLVTYLSAKDLDYGLYLATNKDTDALHGEIVARDEATVSRYQKRAEAVVYSPAPLERIHQASLGYWKCRFCDFAQTCHKAAPERVPNCRTCRSGTPLPDGAWVCSQTGEIRDAAAQIRACEDWAQRF